MSCCVCNCVCIVGECTEVHFMEGVSAEYEFRVWG